MLLTILLSMTMQAHMDACYDYGIWTIEVLEHIEQQEKAHNFILLDGMTREDICADLEEMYGA